MADYKKLRVPLVGGVVDQDLTVIVDGTSFRVRVFYSTFSQLWWLELSLTDGSVTLSQIILRPEVMRSLNGWLPGYGGELYIGMLQETSGAIYTNIDAFSNGFSLCFFSGAE
ncbi:hypothetical protein JGY68_002175 [Salmonella enterica]|uniref:hypothetical protein n=1 Tax=Salmonella enterica TaxID=28901 RepID=UPI0016027929|nr:hypothetical protein [Salmonella enterica]EEC6738918.1 hypothetical protein [Salmonella enterica subsp. enterica serovar Telelkebir]EFU6990022.1 hypothetical protein [Salmonella enterica subsp. enterica serovar Agbeni]EGF8152540.1 hypothetical protein [Salmonella enterica subsp. enterica serovar Enteritidis]EHS8052943.1 hypothetical protein [Salmonella enterica subsp. enterica]EIG0959537.1 hypothetical protein [Salmonella enterica subsp. enterica serovar Tudu]HBJ6456751.1 hypothetical prot